ncbi:LOW QUALITY PROTEIN: crossover junction endonuclease MUS81-like [Primulina tabacum]|uniref:LOW QUALITY PROTEIN: crossover junction endonuclease MUS81-like n=1 Tax=Primulina tabacum TaxID=48773 RepID=UPI003F5919A6
MENLKQVACSENEELAAYLLNKRKEMAQGAKGISDNVDSTLYKAYSNVCNCNHPLKTLRDLSQIKGVGKWILKQMKGFFEADSDPPGDDLNIRGNKNKGLRRYIPQKNSVAYALLISLYRGTENDAEFMRKKELIDAAETSGLSRVPIAPEKAKGKGGHFGSSPRDWYSGWSCMKTLITRGLVVKSSCPAKYMLTEEGKEVARECLLRSGLADPNKSLHSLEKHSNLNPSDLLRVEDLPASECDIVASSEKVVQPSTNLKKQKILHVPPEYLEKQFLGMGFSQQQIIRAYSEVTETSQTKEISSLWPSVLCRLREDEIYGRAGFCASENVETRTISTSSNQKSLIVHDLGRNSYTMKACSSTDHAMNKLSVQELESKSNTLAVPPLTLGEKFGDVYEVVLILDNREQFATQGSRSRKIIDGICSQFQIKIEIRRLPVGDCIWIAHHKYFHSEYVLDFIVERKKVDDLRHSIRDNRYKDQKLRLLRCGLKKMIYLLEGDPNSSEAAESIKTACFTTEILEGFDVQRTSGLADTLRKYGFLTQAINHYYRSLDPELKNHSFCLPFDEFIKRCEELDEMRVSDVFAVQLMQVPHVTEDVALAVIDLYPTLLSLAHAYSILDCDISAQEEMLTKQSNNLINAQASKNIFQLIWGD